MSPRRRFGGGEPSGDMSFLASVSDLMAGLIFVFIITLVIFVLHFSQATGRLEGASTTRAEMLRIMESQLRQRGLIVNIDTLQGLLRLEERSINFPVGSAEPLPEHVERVVTVGRVLREVLPCFVQGLRNQCAVGMMPDTLRYAGSVETVLVEGHTDVRRIVGGSRYRSNMELSGARASRITAIMTDSVPSLDSLRNRRGLRILSISGYGEFRLADVSDPYAVSNRRIDLRFLMEPPELSRQAPVVARVEERLRQ